MTLRFKNTALKALRKMPRRDADAIVARLKVYADTGRGDVKKLVDGNGEYRLRYGNWRAIFVRENGVLVLRVVKRGRAYK